MIKVVQTLGWSRLAFPGDHLGIAPFLKFTNGVESGFVESAIFRLSGFRYLSNLDLR